MTTRSNGLLLSIYLLENKQEASSSGFGELWVPLDRLFTMSKRCVQIIIQKLEMLMIWKYYLIEPIPGLINDNFYYSREVFLFPSLLQLFWNTLSEGAMSGD